MAGPFRHERGIKVSKVIEQEIRRRGFQFLGGRDAGTDGNCENMVFACSANVLRGVSNESDWRVVPDEIFAAGAINCDTRQAATRRSHLAESAESEEAVEPRAGKLSPSDSRQVSGHKRQRRAGVRQLLKDIRRAGTRATSQIRSDAFVDFLRAFDDPRHERCGPSVFGACSPQHQLQDVGIEHTVNRDPIGRGFESRHVADSFDQRLPVIRAGAANQCAVYIEKNKRASQLTVYGARAL